MPADIKGMLDAIIDGANNKFPNTVNSTINQNPGTPMPTTFDAGKFREKLSLYVLKDIISAMMHDETKDLNGMIDQSIMQHIRDDYGDTCYGYLCKSRDKLNSPLLSDIIQEIDEKTMRIQSKVVDRQDDSATEEAEDMKDELKNIENYDDFRKKIKEIIANKVVNDVANVVKTSDDAPVFDNLDDKLKEKKQEEIPLEAEDMTNESTILKMTGIIVSEGAGYGIDVSTEDAMNAAIIEYCLCEMDYLFKMDPSMEHRREWDSNTKVLQESFFDRIEVFQELTLFGLAIFAPLAGALIASLNTLITGKYRLKHGEKNFVDDLKEVAAIVQNEDGTVDERKGIDNFKKLSKALTKVEEDAKGLSSDEINMSAYRKYYIHEREVFRNIAVLAHNITLRKKLHKQRLEKYDDTSALKEIFEQLFSEAKKGVEIIEKYAKTNDQKAKE